MRMLRTHGFGCGSGVRVRWIASHTRRRMTTWEIDADVHEVVRRMWLAMRRPPSNGKARDGVDGPSAANQGEAFVTGRISADGLVRFRLVGYREREWLGRATRYADPHELMKPRLIGFLEPEEHGTKIQFRIDVFQSCVSFWVLLTTSGLFLIATVATWFLSGFPRPGLTVVLSIISLALGAFAFNIWLLAREAQADESLLFTWLERALKD